MIVKIDAVQTATDLALVATQAELMIYHGRTTTVETIQTILNSSGNLPAETIKELSSPVTSENVSLVHDIFQKQYDYFFEVLTNNQIS